MRSIAEIVTLVAYGLFCYTMGALAGLAVKRWMK